VSAAEFAGAVDDLIESLKSPAKGISRICWSRLRADIVLDV
jgi:hypothetical protein